MNSDLSFLKSNPKDFFYKKINIPKTSFLKDNPENRSSFPNFSNNSNTFRKYSNNLVSNSRKTNEKLLNYVNKGIKKSDSMLNCTTNRYPNDTNIKIFQIKKNTLLSEINKKGDEQLDKPFFDESNNNNYRKKSLSTSNILSFKLDPNESNLKTKRLTSTHLIEDLRNKKVKNTFCSIFNDSNNSTYFNFSNKNLKNFNNLSNSTISLTNNNNYSHLYDNDNLFNSNNYKKEFNLCDINSYNNTNINTINTVNTFNTINTINNQNECPNQNNITFKKKEILNLLKSKNRSNSCSKKFFSNKISNKINLTSISNKVNKNINPKYIEIQNKLLKAMNDHQYDYFESHKKIINSRSSERVKAMKNLIFNELGKSNDDSSNKSRDLFEENHIEYRINTKINYLKRLNIFPNYKARKIDVELKKKYSKNNMQIMTGIKDELNDNNEKIIINSSKNLNKIKVNFNNILNDKKNEEINEENSEDTKKKMEEKINDEKILSEDINIDDLIT